MEIFIMYDNGENKQTPAFACVSKRIRGDFDEQKMDEMYASFKADVKKMVASQASENLLASISKEEEVVA